MKVTRVKMHVIHNPRQNLLAYCTLTLDEQLSVNDVTLVSGVNGPFLCFPSVTGKRRCTDARCGKNCRQVHRFCPWCGRKLPFFSPPWSRFDVAHPINWEFRKHVTEEVLKEYAAQGGVIPDTPLPRQPSLAEDDARREMEAVEERHDEAG